MTYGVGASGFVGIAVETTSGTYLAPTMYLNLRSESLKYVQEPLWRRLLPLLQLPAALAREEAAWWRACAT